MESLLNTQVLDYSQWSMQSTLFDITSNLEIGQSIGLWILSFFQIDSLMIHGFYDLHLLNLWLEHEGFAWSDWCQITSCREEIGKNTLYTCSLLCAHTDTHKEEKRFSQLSDQASQNQVPLSHFCFSVFSFPSQKNT